MKPVNSENRAKSGVGVSGIGQNRAKSGKTKNPKKGACLSRPVSKSTTNESDLLPEIPGVDQFDDAPAGSRVYVPNFYSDEVALLTKRATRVLDRAAIFIAPRIGWPKSIYWKPEAAR